MPTASALSTIGGGASILTKEQFPDFLETNFQAVNKDLMQNPLEGLQLYKEEVTSLDHIKTTALVGFPMMQKNRSEEKVPFATSIQGFDNTYTPAEYRLGLRYGRRIRETAQYGLISESQRALMESAIDSFEYDAVIPFSTAFATTPRWLCADGMNLCDKVRPLEDKSGTWDNEDTAAALSQNALETMMINFQRTVNGRGLIRGLQMKKLVVPVWLARKAKELTGSEKSPEDSLNRINVFKGAVDVVVLSRLTSQTAWFGLIDTSSSNYQLKWVWGNSKGGQVETWTDGSNPDVTCQRIRAVWTNGCDSAKGIRGNAGA